MGWYTSDTKALIGNIVPWVPSRSYPGGTYVSYVGQEYGGLYMSKLGLTAPVGVAPSNTSPYWDLVVPGMPGARGQTGLTGDTSSGDLAFTQISGIFTELGLTMNPDDIGSLFEAIKTIAAAYGGGSSGTGAVSCQQIKDIIENNTVLDMETGQLTVTCGQDSNLTPPVVVSPATGTTLYTSTCTVGWALGTLPVDNFRLVAGGSANSNSYYDSAILSADSRSQLVSGLPTDGSVIYFTLMYYTNAVWKNITFTATALNQNNPQSSYAVYDMSTGILSLVNNGTASYADGSLQLTSTTETYTYTNGYLGVSP